MALGLYPFLKTTELKHPKPKINKQIEKLLPPLSEEKYEGLKQAIKTSGLHSPIDIALDGTVLDGHNRLKICGELGITPITRVVEITGLPAEKVYALEANVVRRQLENDFQRAELAIPLLEAHKESAKQRQKAGKKISKGLATFDSKVLKGKATNLVAKMVGMSGKTFERAIYVSQHSSKDMLEELRSGKLRIARAYHRIRGKKRDALHALRNTLYTAKAWEALLQKWENDSLFRDSLKLDLNQYYHRQILDVLGALTCSHCGSKHLKWDCGISIEDSEKGITKEFGGKRFYGRATYLSDVLPGNATGNQEIWDFLMKKFVGPIYPYGKATPNSRLIARLKRFTPKDIVLGKADHLVNGRIS
jgi:ParB-like chromosome segregation protein Spo0J